MPRVVTVLLCLLFLSGMHEAQQKNFPFSSIQINAGVLVNSNRNLFHEFWKPGKGFYIFAETPFYFGDISLGAFHNKFENRTNAPAFKNYFIFAGWGKSVILPFNISLTTGLKAGSNIFSFVSDSITYFGQTESEFALGVFSRLNLEILGRINFSISADMENIFTNRRIKLIFISAGLGYRIPAPDWLRDFLK